SPDTQHGISTARKSTRSAAPPTHSQKPLRWDENDARGSPPGEDEERGRKRRRRRQPRLELWKRAVPWLGFPSSGHPEKQRRRSRRNQGLKTEGTQRDCREGEIPLIEANGCGEGSGWGRRSRACREPRSGDRGTKTREGRRRR
ncbi:unnamed protein product, partial [Ixodes hexagonus]